MYSRPERCEVYRYDVLTSACPDTFEHKVQQREQIPHRHTIIEFISINCLLLEQRQEKGEYRDLKTRYRCRKSTNNISVYKKHYPLLSLFEV
jgi:hypothetical protein